MLSTLHFFSFLVNFLYLLVLDLFFFYRVSADKEGTQQRGGATCRLTYSVGTCKETSPAFVHIEIAKEHIK